MPKITPLHGDVLCDFIVRKKMAVKNYLMLKVRMEKIQNAGQDEVTLYFEEQGFHTRDFFLQNAEGIFFFG